MMHMCEVSTEISVQGTHCLLYMHTRSSQQAHLSLCVPLQEHRLTVVRAATAMTSESKTAGAAITQGHVAFLAPNTVLILPSVDPPIVTKFLR